MLIWFYRSINAYEHHNITGLHTLHYFRFVLHLNSNDLSSHHIGDLCTVRSLPWPIAIVYTAKWMYILALLSFRVYMQISRSAKLWTLTWKSKWVNICFKWLAGCLMFLANSTSKSAWAWNCTVFTKLSIFTILGIWYFCTRSDWVVNEMNTVPEYCSAQYWFQNEAAYLLSLTSYGINVCWFTCLCSFIPTM